MDHEKKVTTETTTSDDSGESTTRTEHTEKTVTAEKAEPKHETKITEEVTIEKEESSD